MSINFSRNRAQVKFESFLGISSSLELKEHKDDFKAYLLSKVDASLLSAELKEDAKDFYYNGLVSFSEGVDSVFNRRFSWATVKLYYSVFYLLRANLALHNIAVLRCRSMYRLIAREGEKPYGTKNSKYSSTHAGTISHYEDIFSSSDKLLTNTIDGQQSYRWLMDAREIVNYRSCVFAEPGNLDFWDTFSMMDASELTQALKELEDDAYVKCFQEEYAIIGVPIKLLLQTTQLLRDKGELAEIDSARIQHLKELLQYDERRLEICETLFG